MSSLPAPTAPGFAERLLKGLAFVTRYRGILALAAVFLLGVAFSPRNATTGRSVFLAPGNQANVLFEYAEYGILAAGMTLVILTAGIDLSVGSVLGLVATAFAWLLLAKGMSPLAAGLIAAALGAFCGLINGLVVSFLRLQPFVATLAMMVAARGAAKVISGGIKVQVGAQDWYAVQKPPVHFFEWMTRGLAGDWLQPVTVLFLVTIIALAIVVRYTAFGRYLYAIGGNEEAARLSGVSVNRVRIMAYVLCGLCAALAGICNASRMELGDPEAGFTYELDAIAAVVIGGTSLMGGVGGMMLTFVGTLIIGYINKILSINAVEEAYRLLAKGAIIVAAVMIQQKRGKS